MFLLSKLKVSISTYLLHSINIVPFIYSCNKLENFVYSILTLEIEIYFKNSYLNFTLLLQPTLSGEKYLNTSTIYTICNKMYSSTVKHVLLYFEELMVRLYYLRTFWSFLKRQAYENMVRTVAKIKRFIATIKLNETLIFIILKRVPI